MNREKFAWTVSIVLLAFLAFQIPGTLAQRDDDYSFVRTLIDIHRRHIGAEMRDARRDVRIDDGAQQADPPRVHFGRAGQAHVHALAHLQERQILLRHLSAQLHFAAFGEAKQRTTAGGRGLTDLHAAGQEDAVGGSAHLVVFEFHGSLLELILLLEKNVLGNCGAFGKGTAPLERSPATHADQTCGRRLP